MASAALYAPAQPPTPGSSPFVSKPNLRSCNRPVFVSKRASFQARYAQRSGIEGTHSQAVSALGLRRTRYFGLPKTALSHVFTAAVINLIHLDTFLEGKQAAKPQVSRFAALAPVELAS